MWRRQSHILAPLTALLSEEAKFTWADSHQKAFKEINAVISQVTLLVYPGSSGISSYSTHTVQVANIIIGITIIRFLASQEHSVVNRGDAEYYVRKWSRFQTTTKNRNGRLTQQ
jgi:hypothetical protein